MSEPTWLVHQPPRITEMTFADILTEGPRVFPGTEYIGDIWTHLTNNGVDPTFALAHFYVESHFGTSGWAVWADPPLHSWGNTLYVNSLLKSREGVKPYPASNGYTYTSYPDWLVGAEDYCLQLAQYRDSSPDRRYGPTETVYGATAKWIGKPLGGDLHTNYLDIVLNRMDKHDARPDSEVDMAIFDTGVTFDTNKTYEIKAGERWYAKAGGTTSYPIYTGGKATYFGKVAGTSWAAIQIRTARLSADNKTLQPIIAYVPNFDPKRLANG